jgi:hypothetical protein
MARWSNTVDTKCSFFSDWTDNTSHTQSHTIHRRDKRHEQHEHGEAPRKNEVGKHVDGSGTYVKQGAFGDKAGRPDARLPPRRQCGRQTIDAWRTDRSVDVVPFFERSADRDAPARHRDMFPTPTASSGSEIGALEHHVNVVSTDAHSELEAAS